jgi:predicted amidophosphoribosyltransferase
MIFNCDSCGKSISSKKEYCPYCKTDIVEFSLMLEKKRLFGTKNLSDAIKTKLKGTFSGIGM